MKKLLLLATVTMLSTTPFTTIVKAEDYKTVTSPKTGKVWMDRNVGATKVASSAADKDAYGKHFIWNKAQDACPSGFRVPSRTDWAAENTAEGYNTFLKLPYAGANGKDSGSNGFYWTSSSLDEVAADYLGVNREKSYIDFNYKSNSFSVRCIKK